MASDYRMLEGDFELKTCEVERWRIKKPSKDCTRWMTAQRSE